MTEFLSKLASLFNRRERWQLSVLLGALMLRACVELVGVGSIAPFIKIVADPSAIYENRWLRSVYEWFGFTSPSAFLTAMGLTVVGILAVSNAISALAVWGMLRFSWSTHHRLCTKLLKGYLAQPYSFFVQRNSASLNETILSEVQVVIMGVLIPVLNVVARLLAVVAISGLLVVLDPVLAALTILILGGVYGAALIGVRVRLRSLGRERLSANHDRYKVAGEAFGGIKDVKVLQREADFASRFAPPSWIFSRTSASNAAIAQLPRYVFETIAFGGIVLLVVLRLRAGSGLEQILPTVSLFAFAGYRLMPELQQLFTAFSSIKFYQASLDELTRDLDRFKPPTPTDPAEPLHVRREIRFDRVTFSYPETRTAALDGVSLTIERNTTVGLVGSSGSGKTTLVDVLLGLYEPESGRVLVDGQPLDAVSIRRFRRAVGYVPQHIFLTDDTVMNNIAFGVKENEIDHDQIERVGRAAALHEFVQSLPDGYRTVVGERGVRLSGGQRQRIGIARALYHDPDVLVLDEATSALDSVTENAVMAAISELAGRKTIVIIAHRISTVRECDRIYMLRSGRVEAGGTYEELTARSATFRAMAKLTSAAQGAETARG